MPVELMAHQTEGVDFLARGRSGLLAFEQGLGKTLVAIDAFRRVWAAREAECLFIICPNSLKRNWVSELRKFAPEFSVLIAEGTPKHRRQTFISATTNVIITSYETARSEVTAILALVQRRRTVLVLDESHSAKNWRSLTATAVRLFAPHCHFRWLLSGTPVTNTPADLYTQVEIIAPGKRILGSQESFMAMMKSDPTGEFAKQRLEGVILRRTKEECLDLPAKTFVDIHVDLPAWQRKLYDDMRAQMVCDIRSMTGEQYTAFASTALAKLTRLSQIASNPALIFPELHLMPGKFGVLDDLISSIISIPGRKIIVWSNYIKTIEALLERFRDKGAVGIYGGTPATERQCLAERFQRDDEVCVLIANPAAAATGFTLTAATHSVYETLSWRYDHYAQSQDRNHRIGQTKPVTYFRLIAADTIEHAIVSSLERKSALARNLLGDVGDELAIAKLTKDQMCALLDENRLPEIADD